MVYVNRKILLKNKLLNREKKYKEIQNVSYDLNEKITFNKLIYFISKYVLFP